MPDSLRVDCEQSRHDNDWAKIKKEMAFDLWIASSVWLHFHMTRSAINSNIHGYQSMCSKEKSRNNAHLAYPTAIRSALRSKVQGIAAVRYSTSHGRAIYHTTLQAPFYPYTTNKSLTHCPTDHLQRYLDQASTITPPSIKTMHITILPPKLRHSASPAITIALRNILVSDLPGSSHTPVTANP
ncbi:hypothetical protein P3342_008342 [Pyrenophora teres f. teres]|nr:hypothetical protein P3342_008342 [Pyrenophora teres f. teres]